jgi:hypothetical protein
MMTHQDLFMSDSAPPPLSPFTDDAVASVLADVLRCRDVSEIEELEFIGSCRLVRAALASSGGRSRPSP